MYDLYEIVKDYFLRKEWQFSMHQSLPVLRMEYHGNHGTWNFYVRVRKDSKQVLFLSVLPEKVPDDKRLLIAEYITRANFGLNIGNFEMDFSDGELRYKTSIDVTYEGLTIGLIEPLVSASLVAMDDYLPGIQSVVAGKSTPVKAIEKARLDIQDDYDLIVP